MTVVAWHNEPKLKAAAIERMKEHRRLDQLTAATYWIPEESSGCQLGCLVHDSHVSATGVLIYDAIERLFGIDAKTASALERYFNHLYAVNRRWERGTGNNPDWHGRWAVESLEAIACGAALGGPNDRLVHQALDSWKDDAERMISEGLAILRSAPIADAPAGCECPAVASLKYMEQTSLERV